MNFTNDEMNLMCIYNTGSRKSLIRELREMCVRRSAKSARPAKLSSGSA